MLASESPAIKRQSKRKRNAAQAAERSFLADQLDWAPPAYSDPPIEPIDADGITAIHNASMRVLEDIGILFLNDADIGYKVLITTWLRKFQALKPENLKVLQTLFDSHLAPAIALLRRELIPDTTSASSWAPVQARETCCTFPCPMLQGYRPPFIPQTL